MSSKKLAGIGKLLVLIGVLAVSACSPTVQAGAQEPEVLHTEFGDATYYACRFQGCRTASGLKFDNHKAVCAHGSFPFGTVARVTNLSNGKSVNVVVVDRGPYGKNRREGAIIDLSRAAAERLDIIQDGKVHVRVDVIKWEEEKPKNLTN
jgi:peptidoglycan lytic transglycosylase